MAEADALKRAFKLRPAYDCIGVQPCVHGSERCKPGSGGSHGRHNAEIHLTVSGSEVEVTVAISTGWDLPTVPAYQRCNRIQEYPRGSWIEYHTALPAFPDQERGEIRADGTCKDWAGCYVWGGFQLADEPARLLVEKGSDAVWEWLEDQHAKTVDRIAALAAQQWGQP